MAKICLALLFVLSTTATSVLAQATSNEPKAVGSLTMSGVFVYQTSSFDSNRILTGWSVVPEVNLTRHLGFQGDFASLYMSDIYPSQSAFAVTAGPRFTFAPRHRFVPFIYGEGGEGRSTTNANNRADWNPLIKAGLVFDFKLNRGLAIELGPADYSAQKIEWRNSWTQSYAAHLGVVFILNK